MVEGSSKLRGWRVPAWGVNCALVALVAGMWQLDRVLVEQMDEYYLRVLILVGLNVILATSLNLINGITGQFSLGHAGFMAIGAYATGSLMKYFSPTGAGAEAALLALLIAGGLVAAVAGLLVGIPTLRLRGDYLAIATLGFGEIIYTLIVTTDRIGPFEIGSSSGLHAIPIRTSFFWAYAGAIVCVASIWRLSYSAKGLAFRAVREDEIAAAAMGIDTTYYKVLAFVIGAFFAGVAGGLYATYDGNLAPESFRFTKSIEIVVMVVLGGSGSITGVVVAAAVLTYLPEQLRFFAEWRMVIYSLALILMMLLRPEGLLGGRELLRWRRVAAATTVAGDAVQSGR